MLHVRWQANGTCDKLNSRLVYALLHGELHVNVATRDVAMSALRGAINTLLYNPQVDKARGEAGIHRPANLLFGILFTLAAMYTSVSF